MLLVAAPTHEQLKTGPMKSKSKYKFVVLITANEKISNFRNSKKRSAEKCRWQSGHLRTERTLLMKTSISKAAYMGLGHCSVCGQWRKLEMWDDGLQGRFCSECFDHVVDAGELLASQGFVPPGPEATQAANNS